MPILAQKAINPNYGLEQRKNGVFLVNITLQGLKKRLCRIITTPRIFLSLASNLNQKYLLFLSNNSPCQA